MTKSIVRILGLLLCFSIALSAQTVLPPQHAQDQNPRMPGTPVLPPQHAQDQNPRMPGTPVLAPDGYKQLKYRYIGPVGNRATAVVGIPGNPWIYYVGAASGGIFKTTDGGTHWDPVFDGQDVSSIGSLALDPSDPNIVWAGTGESFVRSHISVGQGIYKSLDAGNTWSLMGLEKVGRIGRVEIDPRNPNVVLACGLGHGYGPQPDRDVFRTTAGGK